MQHESTSPARPTSRRNAVLVVLGAAVSQGVLFGSLVLFARLFEPEAIGLQALLVSVQGLLVTFASARLDLAIVLERDPDDARRVATHAVGQSLVVAIGVGILVAVAGDNIARVLAPDVESHLWVWLLPVALAGGVLFQVGMAEANRVGRFLTIIGGDVTTSVLFAIAGLLMWVLAPRVDGLVLARILAVAGGVVFLASTRSLALRWTRNPWRGIRTTWARHRQFLVFNTPYSLMASFTRDLPILVFSVGGGAAVAAAYVLARSITVAPVALFASALSRVFYKEAADYHGTARFAVSVRNLTAFGMFAGLVPFSFLAAWGDLLVPALLGDSWDLAGQMAVFLAPAVWMSLQTGWPERIFEVTGRQSVSFALQLGFDLLNFAVIVGVYVVTDSARDTVLAFGVTYFAYHMSYLVAVHWVAGFSLHALGRTLAGGITGFLALTAAFVVLRSISGPATGAALWASAIVAIAVLAGVLLWWGRRVLTPTAPR